MKHLATAVAAVLSISLPASAQMYPPAWQAPPYPYYSALRPEMMDDGSSSDFPVHMPGDFFVADELNRQIRAGNAVGWR